MTNPKLYLPARREAVLKAMNDAANADMLAQYYEDGGCDGERAMRAALTAAEAHMIPLGPEAREKMAGEVLDHVDIFEDCCPSWQNCRDGIDAAIAALTEEAE